MSIVNKYKSKIYRMLMLNPYVDYKTCRLIKNTEFMSHNELAELQFNLLVNIVNYAWEHISGYKSFWESNNFEPSKLKTLDDVRLIPVITKKIINTNLDSFTNHGINDKMLKYTGGSTGLPFSFYHDRSKHISERVFIDDIWKRRIENYDPRMSRVSLRGDKIDGIYKVESKRRLVLSTYSLNEGNVGKYVGLIDEFGAGLLHAYPSAAYLLSQLIEKKGLELKNHFKLIALGSEKLFPFQKEKIALHLGSSITHWYGLAEGICLAGYCGKSEGFHIYPQYALTEVLNSRDLQIAEGEVGEIVGTNFWNYATPLIRYRPGDWGKLGADRCELCKRNYQILDSIEGRVQECFVDINYQTVISTGYSFLMPYFTHVIDSQYIQNVPGEVELAILRSEQYTKDDEYRIKRALKDMYKGRVDFKIRYVDKIPRTTMQKKLYVIQNVDKHKIVGIQDND